MTGEGLERLSGGRGVARLFFGVLAGPVGWFLHLSVSYLLVPYVCRGEAAVWLLHLTTAAAVALAGTGLVVSWRSRRWTNGGWRASGGEIAGRSRFLAVSGVALSASFFLVIAVQAVPNFVIGPCR